MEWVTMMGKLGLKMALNASLPGSGSAVDFAEAVKCFYYGDVYGGMINGFSGAMDIVSLGLVGATKEAMKESAKGAVVQSAKHTAKSAAKEASRKVGQDLGKQLAMGTIKGGKDAAVEMAKQIAKSASKEATRKVGQQIAKELSKGVISSVVEEVWSEGTKMTYQTFLQKTWLSAFSSGGQQVGKTVFEDLMPLLIDEMMNRKPMEAAFELTKEAAKKGAKKAFMNPSYGLFIQNLATACMKAGLTCNETLLTDNNSLIPILPPMDEFWRRRILSLDGHAVECRP